MSQVISPEFTEITIPDLNDIIIEDETPVDNLISEKQQRLLVHSLYSSLNRETPFLATANVEAIGLGLTLWEGIFEGKAYTWLRWCDREGNLLLTGDERAEQEHQRAEQEYQRAERLAALLRAQGINPEV